MLMMANSWAPLKCHLHRIRSQQSQDMDLQVYKRGKVHPYAAQGRRAGGRPRRWKPQALEAAARCWQHRSLYERCRWKVRGAHFFASRSLWSEMDRNGRDNVIEWYNVLAEIQTFDVKVGRLPMFHVRCRTSFRVEMYIQWGMETGIFIVQFASSQIRRFGGHCNSRGIWTSREGSAENRASTLGKALKALFIDMNSYIGTAYILFGAQGGSWSLVKNGAICFGAAQDRKSKFRIPHIRRCSTWWCQRPVKTWLL